MNAAEAYETAERLFEDHMTKARLKKPDAGELVYDWNELLIHLGDLKRRAADTDKAKEVVP